MNELIDAHDDSNIISTIGDTIISGKMKHKDQIADRLDFLRFSTPPRPDP